MAYTTPSDDYREAMRKWDETNRLLVIIADALVKVLERPVLMEYNPNKYDRDGYEI